MKKILNYTYLLVLLLFITGCNQNQSRTLDGEELEQYKKTRLLAREVESTLKRTTNIDYSAAMQLLSLSKNLQYDYNPFGLDSASVVRCEDLQERLDAAKELIYKLVENNLGNLFVPVVENIDYLVEKNVVFPVYLKRGEKLYVNIKCKNPATIKVYNYDLRSTVKTISKQTKFNFNVEIENSAIYLVEFNLGNAQYADVNIAYTANTIERLTPIKVNERTVEAKKGDFFAWSTPGIEMIKIFDEPRKFTLRGQLKAAFSGTYRGIVPIQVPAGATDILYSMRISTNEADRSSDGEFGENMNTSYRKVKMLGLPVYESNKSSGIIKTILGDYTPLREEDAYINMYVFNSSSHAKKFNDRNTNGNIVYDINHSIMGMQSSTGRIPVKGKSVIYLGFENERTRYANYVWVEVLASKPIKEYFKTEYYLN